MAHLGPHLYSEDSDIIIEPASDVFEIDDFTSPFVQLKDANKAQEFIQPINVMAFVCSTPLYLIKPL